MLKSLVRKYTEPAIEELVRIAGMKKEYARDSEGKLVLDAEGNPKLIAIPGSASDTARIQAINILLERGFGKATQKIAGDEDEAPVQVQEVRRRIIRPDDE